MNSKRIVSLFLVGFVLIAGARWGYNEFTGDFCAENITCTLPDQIVKTSSSESLEQHTEIDRILNQSFSWLGQGMQTYAFASEDGKYVLKIFKFKRLKTSSWTPYLASIPILKKYFDEAEQRRQRRIHQLFGGYEVAYTQDRSNTGLLYIHLHETESLHRNVTITDRLGRKHLIGLDGIRFAIQERASTTKQVLIDLLQRGDIAAVKRRIRSLFDMYMDEYRRGLLDNDQNILANTGFHGEVPLRIDMGRLENNPQARDPVVYKDDLSKIAKKRLNAWFLKHYPAIQPELAQDMQEKLSELFDEPFIW